MDLETHLTLQCIKYLSILPSDKIAQLNFISLYLNMKKWLNLYHLPRSDNTTCHASIFFKSFKVTKLFIYNVFYGSPVGGGLSNFDVYSQYLFLIKLYHMQYLLQIDMLDMI